MASLRLFVGLTFASSGGASLWCLQVGLILGLGLFDLIVIFGLMVVV